MPMSGRARLGSRGAQADWVGWSVRPAGLPGIGRRAVHGSGGRQPSPPGPGQLHRGEATTVVTRAMRCAAGRSHGGPLVNRVAKDLASGRAHGWARTIPGSRRRGGVMRRLAGLGAMGVALALAVPAAALAGPPEYEQAFVNGNTVTINAIEVHQNPNV